MVFNYSCIVVFFYLSFIFLYVFFYSLLCSCVAMDHVSEINLDWIGINSLSNSCIHGYWVGSSWIRTFGPMYIPGFSSNYSNNSWNIYLNIRHVIRAYFLSLGWQGTSRLSSPTWSMRLLVLMTSNVTSHGNREWQTLNASPDQNVVVSCNNQSKHRYFTRDCRPTS